MVQSFIDTSVKHSQTSFLCKGVRTEKRWTRLRIAHPPMDGWMCGLFADLELYLLSAVNRLCFLYLKVQKHAFCGEIGKH